MIDKRARCNECQRERATRVDRFVGGSLLMQSTQLCDSARCQRQSNARRTTASDRPALVAMPLLLPDDDDNNRDASKRQHEDSDDDDERAESKRMFDAAKRWLRSMDEYRVTHPDDLFFMHRGGRVFDNEMEVVLDESVCPLLEHYEIRSVLGSGNSLGVVLHMRLKQPELSAAAAATITSPTALFDPPQSPGGSPPPPTTHPRHHHYAAKFQLIADETLFELQAELGVNVLLSMRTPLTWQLNVVRLLDWVRCIFDLRRALRSMRLAVPPSLSRVGLTPADQWQVMLFEGALGSLADRLVDALRAIDSPLERANFVRALITQVMCTQWLLYVRVAFLHRDLHEGNVLLADGNTDPTLQRKRAICYDVPRSNFVLFVPLQWTHYHVAKLADMGRARVCYRDAIDTARVHTIGAYADDYVSGEPANARRYPRGKSPLATELAYVIGIETRLVRARIALDGDSERHFRTLVDACRQVMRGDDERAYNVPGLLALPFFDGMRVNRVEKQQLIDAGSQAFVMVGVGDDGYAHGGDYNNEALLRTERVESAIA
jgi:hypothetical protein